MVGKSISGSSGWLIALGLLSTPWLAGCGLGDYQEKMAEQQKLIERVEKENKDLGRAIDVSSLARDMESSINVFLRPPNGINLVANDQRYANVLSVYEGSGSMSLYLASSVKKQNLEKEIRGVVAGFGAKEIEHPSSFTTNPPPGGKEHKLQQLTFQSEGEDGRKYSFLVYITEKRDLAIMYQIAGDITDQAKDIIQTSLGTLGVGNEANQRKKFYQPPS